MNPTTSEEITLNTRGYRLLDKLGQGSYAKVYLGEFKVKSQGQEETERITHLACKVIDINKAPSTFVEKFLPRELEILLKLNHPHVIHTHSLFRRKSKYYIFMRYAENGDLLAFIIKNGLIRENQARIWTRQLCLGLQYLHTLEIAHRDIKCENILVTGNFNVKLADFGFARFLLDERMNPVLSKTFCGSLQYAAPEIIKGTPYNPKLSDVWALGVVVFTMLNKSMPFDDDNAKSLYNHQIKRKWRFRTKVVDKLSHEVKSLIKKMLEPTIEERIKLDEVIASKWIQMDDRLKSLLPDEFGALIKAKEHIQMVKNGTLKLKNIRDHHPDISNDVEKARKEEQTASNTTVDMKTKGYSFIESKITPTSTIKLMQDKTLILK
ncbi:testis-specific serine/threonine-protein kinase 1-like [Culicoides brevitarsis]|uniref:testis-specific serine/threonine-protein kinase 1-like n=1 Tax=Culicoides brevitarsis TaxID=469753 RepID=UPI00307C4B44